MVLMDGEVEAVKTDCRTADRKWRWVDGDGEGSGREVASGWKCSGGVEEGWRRESGRCDNVSGGWRNGDTLYFFYSKAESVRTKKKSIKVVKGVIERGLQQSKKRSKTT